MEADTDAGAISTYVQACAPYGTRLLWILLLRSRVRAHESSRKQGESSCVSLSTLYGVRGKDDIRYGS
jgi:hypothetical protein